MNKQLIAILLIFLVLPMVSGVRQNDPLDIKHAIRINGAPSSAISANITVEDPQERIVAVGTMSYDSNTLKHNFSLDSGNTSQLGTYVYTITASTLGLNETNEFNYLVTLTGNELPSTAQAIVYWAIAFLSLFLFILALIGAIKIPYKNDRSEQGYLLRINDLKYVKIFLWFVTYLMLIFIAFSFSNVSQVANWSLAYRFLDSIFFGLLVFVLPTFIFLMLFSFINFFHDLPKKRLLERNLKIK